MRQYGMLQALFMSFYSRKLYRDVVASWGGYAFLYLLFIIAVAWVFFSIQFQSSLNAFYAKHSAAIVNQLPVLTIDSGIISTPEKKPYIIMEGKERIAVIDTTGRVKTLKEAKAPILITDVEIISQTKPEEIRKNTIPENVTMVLDPDKVNEYLKTYLSYAWLLFFPVMVLLSFVYRFIQVLLYSIIGKIFSAMTGAGLSYGQIMLVSMIALTPVTAVSTILFLLDVRFDYQYFMYFLLSILYMCYGIRANKGI